MKKYLYLILILCAISLTGCGTKDVVYDTKDSVNSNTAEGETASVESSGGTVAQTLGIEEDKWREEIGSGADKIYINAKLEIPEVSDMYTLEVSEHYAAPEEQKKIAEYFLDTDTIRVNKNKVISKEWLQRRLDYLRGRMVNEEYYDSSDEEYAKSLHNNKVLSNEIDRLTELINDAPNVSDISETVKDYSENYYLGSKGDVEYTLYFDMDEGNNISSWKLEAVDGNDFTSKKISSEVKKNDWRGAWFGEQDEHENLCAMTREQAEKKAEEICGQLGISGLKIEVINDLVIYLERGQEGIIESEYEVPYELNGYSVVLVRDINGVSVDGVTYYHEDGRYLDRETTEKPYNMEKVVIEFNDTGIISMTCEGQMSVKETGNAVKLLSYEQIQEIFRKELSGIQMGEEGKFTYLYLMYKRVRNEQMPDEYCYIPVWCLSTEKLYELAGLGITSGIFVGADVSDVLFINAIDGNRIDPEKAGFVDYHDIMDNLEFLDE